VGLGATAAASSPAVLSTSMSRGNTGVTIPSSMPSRIRSIQSRSGRLAARMLGMDPSSCDPSRADHEPSHTRNKPASSSTTTSSSSFPHGPPELPSRAAAGGARAGGDHPPSRPSSAACGRGGGRTAGSGLLVASASTPALLVRPATASSTSSNRQRVARGETASADAGLGLGTFPVGSRAHEGSSHRRAGHSASASTLVLRIEGTSTSRQRAYGPGHVAMPAWGG
jgi:hypothetical protein